MNVAIIGSRGYPYVYSGYETFIKELSERLVKKNIKITIYCHKGLFIERPAKINNIRLVYIPTIETKSLSQPIHSLLSFIHCSFKKPDLILVVNVANGPFGIISKILGIPTIINVDGLEWLRPKWKGLGGLYFKYAAKLATIFYDQIVNDSEEMRRVYKHTFNCESVVIAYGEKPSKPVSIKLLASWKIKPREYYLIVGRLIPDNNANILISGFLKSETNKKLVVVGDVNYKDNYSEDLKNIKDKRLIFTGYVRNPSVLSELYHNCYVYLHGHEFGGTNPTMLKALASGCSILALDTPFNREMLMDGKFGLFFNKGSTMITEMINYCEKNKSLMTKLRSNSVKGIKNKYDWNYITDRYIKIFDNLIKNR